VKGSNVGDDFQVPSRAAEAVEAVMFDAPDASRRLAAVLKGSAHLYGTAMRYRARLYQRRRLTSHRLPCKVVSVGNITIGGTGKTPMALYLARMINAAGCRTAVISRGYRGRAEKQGGVVSDGHLIRMGPDVAGDEPYLMAQQLLPMGIPVIVGRNRVRSGWLAAKRFHTEVLVLDDGFQHLRLQRDLDLVLLDARRPFGNGFPLPRGILREPIPALSRADACLLTRCPLEVVGRKPRPENATASPRLPGAGDRRVFPAAHVPYVAEWISGGRTDRPPGVPPREDMLRQPIFAFSGIARNDDFQAALREMGFDLRGWADFDDHHGYSRTDIAALEGRADRQGAGIMVTTQKDRVKIDPAWVQRMPLLVVGVQMHLGVYTEAFQRFVASKLGL